MATNRAGFKTLGKRTLRPISGAPRKTNPYNFHWAGRPLKIRIHDCRRSYIILGSRSAMSRCWKSTESSMHRILPFCISSHENLFTGNILARWIYYIVNRSGSQSKIMRKIIKKPSFSKYFSCCSVPVRQRISSAP